MSQERNKLKEEERNINRAISWQRNTTAFITTNSFTLGTRTILSKALNLTVKLQRLWEKNTYNHKDGTNAPGSSMSAFIDEIKSSAYKVTTKLTWKPYKKLMTSLRYQLSQELFDVIATPADQNQPAVQSRTVAHIFTYNVSTRSIDKLLLNLAISQQFHNTTTPIASNTGFAMPGFNAGYQTGLVSASYFPTESLSIINTFAMTLTRNFNDFLATSLPLAVSNTSISGSIGINWSPKDKDYSIEPHYSYYSYDGSSVSETGDYSAHVGWIDVALKW